MQNIILRIAGFYIQINFFQDEWQEIKNNLKTEIEKYFRGFISNAEANKIDFTVNIKGKNNTLLIKKGNLFFSEFYKRKNKKSLETFYHVGIMQFQLIIRDILAELLVKHRGIMLHASACLVGDKAYLFLGKSGSGKSTITSLLSDKYRKLADDISIIKKEHNKYYFYQAPLLEKDKLIKKGQKKYELGKIFILKKAKKTLIQSLKDRSLIFPSLVNQLWTNGRNDRIELKNLTGFISDFNQFYKLYFTKNQEELYEKIQA